MPGGELSSPTSYLLFILQPFPHLLPPLAVVATIAGPLRLSHGVLLILRLQRSIKSGRILDAVPGT
jgi:hypothetical protein